MSMIKVSHSCLCGRTITQAMMEQICPPEKASQSASRAQLDPEAVDGTPPGGQQQGQGLLLSQELIEHVRAKSLR